MSNQPIAPAMPINDLFLEKIGFVFTPHAAPIYLEHIGTMYLNFQETAIYCIENNIYLIAHQGKKIHFGKIESQGRIQEILEDAQIPIQNFQLDHLALK